MSGPTQASALDAFLRRAPRLFVRTGVGCSTASGIPDYRDEKGEWKHKSLVPQNVDGLHQKAGSQADLHGRLDTVRCLECGATVARVLHDLLQKLG